ncbi:helix-turn-helix domain-containing protein [Microbacterium arabinogalactanolyticum]|uniref:helix-turn-helix domain-containing protein n=1 Tax=Microbacterium arabinogalactanolyticum TaxID=69365 RepID=UPI00404457B5
MLIRDGFPGQRLRVLSPPIITAAVDAPITERLLVTDAGFFPHAADHGRVRPKGARETIVIICTAGHGRILLDDIPHRVGPGDAAVIPAGTAHMYLADQDDPWTIWWMHVVGRDVQELLPSDAAPVTPLHDVYAATALITQVVERLEVDDTVASLYETSGAAWHLLAHLGADRLRGGSGTRPRIHAAMAYLRENLATTVGVSELAKMANLSPSHFAALFKTTTGMGVIEYLARLRSAQARELLLTTSMSIQDIAEAVGYADPYYFSRQFRRLNGVSPREFRARRMRETIARPNTSVRGASAAVR